MRDIQIMRPVRSITLHAVLSLSIVVVFALRDACTIGTNKTQGSIEHRAGEPDLQLVRKQSSLDHVDYSPAISRLCPAVTSVYSLPFRPAIPGFFAPSRNDARERSLMTRPKKESRQIDSR